MKTVTGSFCFLLLLIVSGCSREHQQKQQPQLPKTSLKEPFKTQLVQFLSTVSQLNAATETSVSKADFRRLVSEAKGKFELLDAFWPQDFCTESKADFREAIKGWGYAAYDHPGGNQKSDDRNYRDFYAALDAYEKTNPFGVKLVHYDPDGLDFIAMIHDSRIPESYDNTPRVLLIASKYFERGKQPVIEAIKN